MMNTVAESYHPKLRADSFFIPGPDGTYFHNALGWYKLTPKIPYALVERVLPFFDGRHSLQMITESLNDVQRRAVTYVLNELKGHGFVRNGSADAEHLNPTLKNTYQAEIAFLEALGENPLERFKNFREARVLVDSPVLLGSTLSAIWSLGLKTGWVSGLTPTELQRLSETRQKIDPEQMLKSAGEFDALRFEQFNLVIQIGHDLQRAQQVAERCAKANVPLVQAVLLPEVAWVQLPDQDHCDPLSLWARSGLIEQSGLRANTILDLKWQGSRGAIIANIVAQHAFRFLSKSTPTGAVFCYEKLSLEGIKHRLSPDMTSQKVDFQTQDQATNYYQRLRETPAISDEDYSTKAAQLIDPRLGVLFELDERDFTQIPLNITEAVVRDARQHGYDGFHVFGVGTDFTTPRVRATKRALELSAATAFDKRHCLMQDEQLLVWGLDLSTQHPELVSANLAFPTIDGASPEHAMPGLASGTSWQDAVEASLISLLLNHTYTQIGTFDQSFSWIDLDLFLTDPQAQRYQQMLCEMNARVEVACLLDKSPIPQVVACLKGEVIAIAADGDPQIAIRRLLERVVQHCQSLLHNEPVYQIMAFPRGIKASWVHGCQMPRAETEVSQCLIAYFQSLGQRVVMVSLNHDPAVQSTGLIIVNGLLLKVQP